MLQSNMHVMTLGKRTVLPPCLLPLFPNTPFPAQTNPTPHQGKRGGGGGHLQDKTGKKWVTFNLFFLLCLSQLQTALCLRYYMYISTEYVYTLCSGIMGTPRRFLSHLIGCPSTHSNRSNPQPEDRPSGRPQGTAQCRLGRPGMGSACCR